MRWNLRRAGIPYVLLGGMSFYDRKEIRDLMAYLKMLVTPADEVALLRIINNPPRGIGQATVTALMEHAVRAGRPLWEMLAAIPAELKITPATALAIDRFRALIVEFQNRLAAEPPLAVVSELIRRIRYQDELARLYKDSNEQQSRWAAVEELVNSLARYQQRETRPDLRQFLDEVALSDRDDSEDKELQLSRNAVALMTLHSAKGLEFPEVYLIGLEEGLLPHHRAVADGPDAIEEERRLCYVGVTRAQERLTLSLALSRMKWGKSRPTIPSCFLYELTGQPEPRRAAVAAAKATGRTGAVRTAGRAKPAAARGKPAPPQTPRAGSG